MKDCMMMQSLINREMLIIPEAESNIRRREHPERAQPADKGPSYGDGRHVPARSARGIRQFI